MAKIFFFRFPELYYAYCLIAALTALTETVYVSRGGRKQDLRMEQKHSSCYHGPVMAVNEFNPYSF